MKYSEIWAYSYEKIRAYLLELGATETGCEFVLPDCRIVLESLPERMISGLSFPQTHVKIGGSEADRIHHQFKLHFLSGGA